MLSNPKNLIVVPGHASFKESVTLPLPNDIYKDRYWVLQAFQKGEPMFYGEHIDEALSIVDENSLLVFSGGRTRKESGTVWSEAKTYDEIAKLSRAYPLGQVALEEYARDSFQNLDFSLRLFESRYGYEPVTVTIVGWLFKQARFRHHAATIGLPQDGFCYLGVNNPPASKLAGAEQGEARALSEFAKNPRGDSGLLLQKRMERDPLHEGNPWYEAS